MNLPINQILCGNCNKILDDWPDEHIDMTMGSPPYGSLRDYHGYELDIDLLSKQLLRITKIGGVVVWVVGDETINGSESGESFKQALMFKDNGWLLHDTMIYAKNSFAYPSLAKRYHQCFEYVFIFVKPENPSPHLSIPDATWLAALIDGEGSFVLTHRKQRYNYESRIIISNTDVRLLNKCKEITGVGTITEREKIKENYRTPYQYIAVSKAADFIAAETYPHLISKKEQAKVLMAYQNLIKKETKIFFPPLTENERLERERLRDLMISLNQHKIMDSGLPEPNLIITRISNGQPKTFNPIMDKPNICRRSGGDCKRQKDGSMKRGNRGGLPLNEFGMRTNIWTYVTGKGHSASHSIAYKHPAIFPEQLAIDHIKSWSNERDLILDPMAGSFTTCVAAYRLNRNYIGIDISNEYCEIGRKRLITEKKVKAGQIF